MIKIKNLTHKYKNEEERALKSVNLHIKKGEKLTLIGSSGSGKSTLLNCINKLIEPISGEILIDGKNILNANKNDLRKFRRQIGIIFQEFNLIERDTIFKNVLNGRLGFVSTIKSCLGIFEKEDYDRVNKALNEVGLFNLKDKKVSDLSGGQKQRVAIARVLVQEPQIILADEPVSNLDPLLMEDILKLLNKLCEEKGITLVTSLHFVQFTKNYFTRVIGLRNGEIIFDGSPKELTEEEFIKIYGRTGF
jgi:phosphonate transport system ATP-binding protein